MTTISLQESPFTQSLKLQLRSLLQIFPHLHIQPLKTTLKMFCKFSPPPSHWYWFMLWSSWSNGLVQLLRMVHLPGVCPCATPSPCCHQTSLSPRLHGAPFHPSRELSSPLKSHLSSVLSQHTLLSFRHNQEIVGYVSLRLSRAIWNNPKIYKYGTYLFWTVSIVNTVMQQQDSMPTPLSRPHCSFLQLLGALLHS